VGSCLGLFILDYCWVVVEIYCLGNGGVIFVVLFSFLFFVLFVGGWAVILFRFCDGFQFKVRLCQGA